MPYSNVDWIAERLMLTGAVAKNMPPSWDGASIAIPVCSPDGQAVIGKALPGRGLYLNRDLKTIGIKKRLPNVFEKTPVMKLTEFFNSERRAVAAAALVGSALLYKGVIPWWTSPFLFQAITTYNGIINARCNSKAFDITFGKVSATSVANQWHALFDTAGMPGVGAFSGTPGTAPTNATVGALSAGIPNPGGSDLAYLLTFGFTSSAQINMAILADLLVQVGSVLINNTAFTVSSAALTRYTTGAGVLATLEVTTTLSATNAGNITMTYTNQAGTGGQVTASTALTISAITGRLMPIALGPYIQLVSGDYGVRAVATITSSSATATTGVVALNLYYPLAMVPGIVGSAYVERDQSIQVDGITQLTATAGGALGCLTLYVLPNSAVTGIMTGFVRTCQG